MADQQPSPHEPSPRPALSVAGGEMQPWSDDVPPVRPTGGPAAAALLAELVPASSSVLVVGPHGDDVVHFLAGHAETVTVLRRSASDAARLAEVVPAGVHVTAGSLDSFVAGSDRQFSCVVALDGLDRVLGTDSPSLDWRARLDLLSPLLAPGGVLVLGVGNDLSAVNVLDGRPGKDRFGDEEWHPLHSDRHRPLSLADAQTALTDIGLERGPSWVRLGEDECRGFLPIDSVSHADPDGALTDFVVAAARSTSRPLLAAPDELVRNAARGGLLTSFVDGWVVSAGTSAGGSVGAAGYLTVHGGAARLVTGEDGLRLEPTPATTRTPESAPDTALDTPAPGLVRPAAQPHPALVEGASVTSRLLRLAEDEDVPGFREVARALGQTVAQWSGSSVLTFDTMRLTDVGVGPGWSDLEWTEPVSTAEALATAWMLFQDRLTVEHRRHPWPPWVVGDELIAIWMSMSGSPVPEQARETLFTRAHSLADAVRAATPGGTLVHRDVRAALADADAATHELMEARGHIFGLERTIGFRDKQLRTREQVIRELRQKVAKVERLKDQKAVRLALKARTLATSDRRTVLSRGKRFTRKAVKKVIRR